MNGEAGIQAVERDLPKWRSRHKPDLIVANAENAAHPGMTPENLDRLQSAGVDFFTSGDHFADNDYSALAEYPVIRPYNVVGEYPGKGARVIEAQNGETVLMVNLIGHDAQKVPGWNYFDAATKVLEENKDAEAQAIFIDFHALSGGEHQSLAWFLDGRVSAVIGTHSHVPSADTRILPKGTAMQSDAGMCGAFNTVIGIQVDRGIAAFRQLVGEKVEKPPMKEQSPPYFCDAVLVETDGPHRAKSIERLTTRPGQTT